MFPMQNKSHSLGYALFSIHINQNIYNYFTTATDNYLQIK